MAGWRSFTRSPPWEPSVEETAEGGEGRARVGAPQSYASSTRKRERLAASARLAGRRAASGSRRGSGWGRSWLAAGAGVRRRQRRPTSGYAATALTLALYTMLNLMSQSLIQHSTPTLYFTTLQETLTLVYNYTNRKGKLSIVILKRR
jgi:hypothetical protein